jgi:hypothetical protein
MVVAPVYLAIISVVSAIFGEIVFAAPFGSIYSKILTDRTRLHSELDLSHFFLCTALPIGVTSDKTLGNQRVHAVARIAALSASLTALGTAYLTSISAIVVQLVFGGAVSGPWAVFGWIVIAFDAGAAILLVRNVYSGKIRESPWPSTGGCIARAVNKTIRRSTPRPYAFGVALGSVFAILVASPLAASH